MSKTTVFINRAAILCSRNILGKRFFSSKLFTTQPKASEEIVADEKPIYEEVFDAEVVMKKRNKSRLCENHRNILMGINPYDKSVCWHHDRVKYKRRIMGRYGMEALGVPAGLAWPLPEEVEDMKEYERVAFPKSLQERWEMLAQQKAEEAERIRRRDEEVAANMAEMDKNIQEFKDKIAVKEAEVAAAKLKKARLIQLVRKELGGNVPIYDDRFKKLMQEKIKEEKQKKKEARKQKKFEHLARIASGNVIAESQEQKQE